MRSLGLLVAVLVLAAGPTRAGVRVTVVPYQSLGFEPQVAREVGEALGRALEARGFTTTVEQRSERAAAMCGEDLECLATVGQRAQARWVLAFGLARIGGGPVVSALLVDVASGERRAALTERPSGLEAPHQALAQRVVGVLLADVSSREAAPPAPRPSLVPWLVATGVVAGLATGTTIGLGVAAEQSFGQLPLVPPGPARDSAVAQQQSLNLGADVALATAIAAGVATAVLAALELARPAAPRPEVAR